MLPDALSEAPASLRRAVIVHELYHVRRRDWVFVLAEELVRTVFWFHPAILWLTAHIQLAREEIVDELTVRATGDRRAYVQALLSFADSGGLSPLDGARGRPAPAFARRRQLFHRILGVSKEKVMSRPRIVLSVVVLAAVVSAASWSASSLFPIVKASSVTLSTPASLIGVQDASLAAPVPLLAEDHLRVSAPALVQAPVPAESRIALLDQQTGIAATVHQVTPENPIPRRTRGGNPAWPPSFAGRQFHVLAQTLVTLDRNGAVIAADRGGCQIVERPAVGERNEEVCGAFSDAAATAIRQWRYERPLQAPLQFLVVATFAPGSEPAISQSGTDWQRYVRETQESLRELSDRSVLADGTAEFLRQQLVELTERYREVERAYRIAAEPYRAGHPIFDRLQQDLAFLNGAMSMLRKLRTSSLETQEQLLRTRDEMKYAQDALRVIERRLLDYGAQATVTGDVKATPTSPFDGTPQLRSPSGRAPVRVGGSVSAPRVIKSPKPEYTAEAMKARIEGTVAIQALVDEKGRVADARILKSIPLLDEQALAAAKQYEFTPALRNGEPVPVLVVIELEFNLRK
jgi:TonB family protein